MSSAGSFLLFQLISAGKKLQCLLTCDFPDFFSVSFTINHWSYIRKTMEFFNKIIFPYLEEVKEEKEFPKGEHSLVIMDTFKDRTIF